MPRYRLPRRQVLAALGAAPVVSILSSRAEAAAGRRHVAAVPEVQSEWILHVALNVRLATPISAAQGRAYILGGRATGPLLDGMVLPGNLEWSVDAERGALKWAAHYDLEAGVTRIHIADRATVPVPSQDYWRLPFSTTPDLEPVNGPSILRHALHLGRMDASQLGAGRLRMNVHRIL
jgi:hypothetical protein